MSNSMEFWLIPLQRKTLFRSCQSFISLCHSFVKMALEVLVFSLLSSYMVAGSDIWTAMYSAEECLDSALLQAAVVADGECVVGALSDGTEVSMVFLTLVSVRIC